MRRREKAKPKATGQKRRPSSSYISEDSRLATSEEVADRTLNRLHNLGKQRFALSPFNEYFDLWLRNLRDVLSEFESSPTIRSDDQFIKERSQILSNVELQLEERRHKEALGEETAESLSNNRILLERIEEEYTTRAREIEGRRDSEIKRLSSSIDGLRGELDRIARTKTGILGVISKKARAQKEAEVTEKLNSTRRELTLALQHFNAEQERLRDEYERRKQPIIEHIRDQQKEIENQEIDGSLEIRRAACEALVNAVSALMRRSRQTTNP